MTPKLFLDNYRSTIIRFITLMSKKGRSVSDHVLSLPSLASGMIHTMQEDTLESLLRAYREMREILPQDERALLVIVHRTLQKFNQESLFRTILAARLLE